MTDDYDTVRARKASVYVTNNNNYNLPIQHALRFGMGKTIVNRQWSTSLPEIHNTLKVGP